MPEQPPQNLADWLAAKQQLAEKLKAAGITEKDYIELYALLDTVTGTDPEAIRARQFEADARDLLTDLKAASEKNVARTSAFLRQFAEHVTRQIVQDGEEVEVTDARVDTLHTLTSWLEKE
jgi:hypothetical protein